MALIKPFRALRPTPDLAEKVAALPYDVYTAKEAKEAAKGNPYSFLHVDKAEIDIDNIDDIYADKVYEMAKTNYDAMISNGWLIRDTDEALYIYRLTLAGRSQTGIAGLASVDEYINGTIKEHELTREAKEKDRIRHIQTLSAQTGPIFLAYKSDIRLKEIIDNYTCNNTPLYDMNFDDGTKSLVWRVTGKALISEIAGAFSRISNLFITDGHHRNAAAVKVALMKREKTPDYTGCEPFNYYLSVMFPDDELHIMDYNRVVKDLNGLTTNEFLKKLGDNFNVTCEIAKVAPNKRHEFGLYINGTWHRLRLKNENMIKGDVLDRLDVSILQNLILGPLLNITDVRTNERIDFIGGIRGLSEIERRVDSGEMRAGFSMYPTSMDELIGVASEGKVMPPKSTWFEPKLRSGIFIHEI